METQATPNQIVGPHHAVDGYGTSMPITSKLLNLILTRERDPTSPDARRHACILVLVLYQHGERVERDQRETFSLPLVF